MAYNLSVCYDVLGGSFIYLDGVSKTAPVRGAHYSPGRGTRAVDALGREVISEEITIDLAGTYRVVTDWITALNVVLEIKKADAWRSPQGRLILALSEPDDATGYYWWAEILDAWLSIDQNGLAQRQLGQQQLTLRITRQDRWEYWNAGSVLNVLMPGGADQATQGWLLNHFNSTAGHANWGYIAKSALKGDLPNRTTLTFRTEKAGGVIGDALIGCGWSDTPAPNVLNMVPTLQESSMTAGAGVTKNDLADATCAGGNYANFDWTVTSEVMLFKATLPTTLYSQNLTHGRPFKPIIRLQEGAGYSTISLKAKVLVGTGSALLYETDWINHTAGCPYIELPPVYIPPDGIYDASGLELAIQAKKTDAMTNTLGVDYLQLWPVDGGFRKYKCLSYMASNGQIYDNFVSGQLYWALINGTGQRAIYNGYGAPILLHPGKTNVITLLNVTSGTTWLIDDQLELFIYAFPAKRNL